MQKPFYLVAGLGQTGYATAGYLHRTNIPFVVFDTRRHVERLTDFSAHFPKVEVFLGDFPSSLYQKITQIIASPGLSLEEPFLLQAKRHGIPIIGDIELFARAVKDPIVAITGTNGKSTVTTLVGEMAKAAGIRVAIAGNIGLPVLEQWLRQEPIDLWVLELSSFQLESLISLLPIAATILNITPDHLDRHGSMQQYIQAKQRVYHGANVIVYNRQDQASYPQSCLAIQHCISFGLDAPQTSRDWGVIYAMDQPYLAYGTEKLLMFDSILLQGSHNWANIVAACALADIAGISTMAMQQVLRTFSGLPHRCQFVRK